MRPVCACEQKGKASEAATRRNSSFALIKEGSLQMGEWPGSCKHMLNRAALGTRETGRDDISARPSNEHVPVSLNKVPVVRAAELVLLSAP